MQQVEHMQVFGQSEQQQQQQQRQNLNRMRRAPGRVTRVVADLMVFVEVTDKDALLGLVFKPNKIDRYRGEPLADLGVYVGANIPSVDWDPETLLVHSVVVEKQGFHPEPQGRTA
jgi:hypothetical protein